MHTEPADRQLRRAERPKHRDPLVHVPDQPHARATRSTLAIHPRHRHDLRAGLGPSADADSSGRNSAVNAKTSKPRPLSLSSETRSRPVIDRDQSPELPVPRTDKRRPRADDATALGHGNHLSRPTDPLGLSGEPHREFAHLLGERIEHALVHPRTLRHTRPSGLAQTQGSTAPLTTSGSIRLSARDLAPSTAQTRDN